MPRRVRLSSSVGRRSFSPISGSAGLRFLTSAAPSLVTTGRPAPAPTGRLAFDLSRSTRRETPGRVPPGPGGSGFHSSADLPHRLAECLMEAAQVPRGRLGPTCRANGSAWSPHSRRWRCPFGAHWDSRRPRSPAAGSLWTRLIPGRWVPDRAGSSLRRRDPRPRRADWRLQLPGRLEHRVAGGGNGGEAFC